MSNDDRVQVAPDCFIQDSAGIFSDKKKEVPKPQQKLPAVPEPVPTKYVMEREVMTVTIDGVEKRVSLVELCRQIATTAEYVSELEASRKSLQELKATCVMIVLQTEHPDKPSVISEIPVNSCAAVAGLSAEIDKANATIKTLLAKVEAKDHA